MKLVIRSFAETARCLLRNVYSHMSNACAKHKLDRNVLIYIEFSSMVENAHCGEIHTIVSFAGGREARKCLVFNELTDCIL